MSFYFPGGGWLFYLDLVESTCQPCLPLRQSDKKGRPNSAGHHRRQSLWGGRGYREGYQCVSGPGGTSHQKRCFTADCNKCSFGKSCLWKVVIKGDFISVSSILNILDGDGYLTVTGIQWVSPGFEKEIKYEKYIDFTKQRNTGHRNHGSPFLVFSGWGGSH